MHVLIAKQSVWTFFKNEYIYIPNSHLFQNSCCGICHDIFCQHFYWNSCQAFYWKQSFNCMKTMINQQFYLKFKLKNLKSLLALRQQNIIIFFTTAFPFYRRSISEWNFLCFLSIFLSVFSLYLTHQSCNKKGTENPPLCIKACLII